MDQPRRARQRGRGCVCHGVCAPVNDNVRPIRSSAPRGPRYSRGVTVGDSISDLDFVCMQSPRYLPPLPELYTDRARPTPCRRGRGGPHQTPPRHLRRRLTASLCVAGVASQPMTAKRRTRSSAADLNALRQTRRILRERAAQLSIKATPGAPAYLPSKRQTPHRWREAAQSRAAHGARQASSIDVGVEGARASVRRGDVA